MAVSQSLSVTQSSQSVANNTSQVRIRWTSTQSGDSWNGYTRTAYYYISINGGSETRYSVSYTLPMGTTKTIVDKTITINHKADGTGRISVRTWMDTDISAGVIEKSQSLTLTTIPRATTPTMPNPTMGNTVTINLPRASSNFTHTLTYAFGSTSGTIATGVGTSASWAVPLNLANQVPNAASGTGTLTCKTYNGSTLIGTKSINFIASVPASVVPTIPAVSIAEATEGLAAKFAAYVQNKSTLAVTITAAGAYSSTITKYETTILGAKYSGASFTSQVLTGSGSVSVSVTVTDSRGRTTTQASTITLRPYFEPRINGMMVWRINTSGTAADDGPRVAVAMDFEIAEVGTRNDRVFSLQYKKESDPDTSFVEFSGGQASWTYSGTQYFISAPEISMDYAYTIRLVITDYFGSVQQDFTVPTAFTIMDFRSTGKGMAIGKVSEKDALEVAMDAYFDKNAQVDGALKAGTLETVGAATFGGNVSGQYISGTWLRSTAHSDLGAAPGSYPVFSDGWIYSRTLAEMRADLAAYEAVPLTVVSGRLTDLNYTARYYPMLGMCFVRIYGKINADLNTGYDYDLISVGSHAPSYGAALAVKCGKDVMAIAQSNGVISLRPMGENIAASSGWVVYISGFWFA